MHDRLQRRNRVFQFFLDNWIYIALAIIMFQLPDWLAAFYDDRINFESIRDYRRSLILEPSEAFNWLDTLNNLYIVAILAMSYNLAFGFAGIISLGHALFFGFATYGMIIFIEDYTYSLSTTTVGMLAFGVLFGLISSLAVLRISGVYFAMFTLALAEIFFQLSRIRIFRFLTGGEDGIRFSDNTPEIATVLSRVDLYYICAASAIGIFVFIRLLMSSRVGKVIRAIRENEARAETMGYNVALYKTLVLVLSCTIASFSGILYALHANGADPVTVLGVGRTIDPLIMTIIGGTGTVAGPVVGAVFLELGERFFRDEALAIDLDFILFRYQDTVNTVDIWPVVLGIVFILIVLIIPFGLVGQSNKVWLELRQWIRKYMYSPLLRTSPGIAKFMQPFTGESPEYALALAEKSKGASLIKWAISYPTALALSTAALAGLVVGLVSWDQRTGFSVLLFLLLITMPFAIGLVTYQNREALLRQIQTLRRTVSQTITRLF
jgi:branched-chain amino acid transport system permease protein